MNNDMTFFTNEPERNLYDRFNKILKRDTQFFDVLVGYFRASGFHLLQDSLDNVEKTRILIGINTDKQVLEMYEESQQQINEFSKSAYESKKIYCSKLKKEFNDSDDSEIVEHGVTKFVEMVKNGKLELRVYNKQPIHAKVYVMRNYLDSSDYGKVITGSSNFSSNGLINNLEFNVELKTSSDVKFAYDKFEELWNDSVDINKECIETIENDTWLKNDITPYQMYLKFLYEYFKEEINDDQSFNFDDGYFISGFKPLQYQKDAVIQAKRIIEKHNGVFISDVVGLGKTYMCALLAKELYGGKLFIVPPVLIDYWSKVLRDFGVQGFEVKSSGALKKICDEKSYRSFKYIFVDEAHKFRNEKTDSYRMLDEICTNKKVVLITATPQNNYITDIANQMYLFESKTNSTIPGMKKLEQFFFGLRSEVNKVKKGTDEYYNEVEKASNKIRDKVLREVMIRRTRSEIQKNYKEDLDRQGIVFPKLGNPVKETYEFDSATETIFEKTIESIKSLTYSRYKPLVYVKQQYLNSEMNQLLTGQRNMGAFMKGTLVKRLESSKYAFEKTLDRFIKSHEQFIKMYNDGEVWISRKLNVDELLDKEDFDTLIDGKDKGNAFAFKSDEFNPSFFEDLQKDLVLLNNLKNMWNSIDYDCKLDYFLNLLNDDKKLHNKVIIFTESKETAEYLSDNITNKLNRSTILFSGSMSDTIKNEIRNNFDPNVEKENIKNDYDILVTTDVLAEGMNLHRSNIIINYDLPWNPTRIMQRVGRINRIGSQFKELYVYNFFPTANSNDLIHQNENIMSKIQMFHDILGEDTKFLTEEENISTHELFKRMTTIDDDEETGLNTELHYLKTIRDVRDNDKKLFNQIKELPLKIKIGRKGSTEELLTFFRKGYVKKFYLSNMNTCEEVNFDTAIEKVKCNQNEDLKKINSKYYVFLSKNKTSFENYENGIDNEFEDVIIRKGKSNSNAIILALKEVLKLDDILSNDELDDCKKVVKLLQDGELPSSLLKNATKMMKNNVKSQNDLIKFYKDFMKMIPMTYFELEGSNNMKERIQKEIVLSELFMG
jgi:superfamily II DNA/RNA helicase